MNKKLTATLCVALGVVTAFTASACSLFSTPRINNYLNETDSVQLMGKDVTLTYTSQMKDDVAQAIDEWERVIDDSSSTTSQFLAANLQVKSGLEELYAQADAANILKYTSSDDSYGETYSEIYAALLEFSARFDTINKKIAQSKFKSYYYAGWTQEEIDEYVVGLDGETSEAASSLLAEIQALPDQYDGTNQSFSTVFSTLKEKGDQLAKLKGFDNYIDYSYAVGYNRDYTAEDTENILEYVKKYIYPIYDYVGNDLIDISNRSEFAQRLIFENLFSGFMGQFKGYFDDYAQTMGGTFYTNYNYLWQSGNYYFTNAREDFTAYTTTYYSDGEAYMAFSRNYQDIRTFSHEFGHYNRRRQYSFSSLDIEEILSQADEILFAQYLIDNASFGSSAGEEYLDYVLLLNLSSIITYAVLNACELYAYQENITDLDVLSAYAQELYFEATGETDNYFADQIAYYFLNCPFYSVSYSTSALSSLGVYAEILKNGFDSAKTLYLDTVTYSATLSYQQLLAKTGLFDPFEEEDYQNLYSLMFATDVAVVA